MNFTGHSLSVSDIVVLRQNGRVSAHYVDSFGFEEVPEFLAGPYKYYSTQRSVDIGTFPKTEGGPEKIQNYDNRIAVEDGRFLTWGVLEYSVPLTEEQADQYELRAAPSNPNLFLLSHRQLDARVQVVGQWEQANNIPKNNRVAELQSDMGRFKLRDSTQSWLVNMRFPRVVKERAHPSIAAQLAEGADRAAKDNAARPVPEKKTDRDR